MEFKKYSEELPPVNKEIIIDLGGGYKSLARYLGDDLIRCEDGRFPITLNATKDFDKPIRWALTGV